MRGLARPEEGLSGSNLSGVAQNVRLRQAVAAMTLGLVLAVLLVRLDVPRLWRISLFIPFALSSLGAVQGLYRTCPMHVNKRERVNARGEVEPVCCPDEVMRAQSLASRVIGVGLLSALVATGLVCILP